MANPDHLRKLKDSRLTWNQWRENDPTVIPDLRDADLSGWGNLSLVDLHEADLSRTTLGGINLDGANLNRANLCDAKIIMANLSGATLGGANLTRARIFRTIFADTNLAGATGLESCIHVGPSSVGIDTLFKSGGTIPDIFLRGCGVPETLITYARSLVFKPIEFYSCFISYSSHNHAFAERLHADLIGRELRCWFAPKDLKIGEHFQERIEESIRLFDKVMIVLSEASVQSRWVEREVNAAREREDRENRTVLFPIRIDDAVMNTPQPWAADIRRSRHIGDFRGWKDHDRYQLAFERLLQDLRTMDRESGQTHSAGDQDTTVPGHAEPLKLFQSRFALATLDDYFDLLLEAQDVLTKSVGEERYRSFHTAVAYIQLEQAHLGMAQKEGDVEKAENHRQTAETLLGSLKKRVIGVVA